MEKFGHGFVPMIVGCREPWRRSFHISIGIQARTLLQGGVFAASQVAKSQRILIPPSIACIVIGLVLGISASTLFQAALIPGLLILTSILVTNIIVNRRMAYESGNQISFREWLMQLGVAALYVSVWVRVRVRARVEGQGRS